MGFDAERCYDPLSNPVTKSCKRLPTDINSVFLIELPLKNYGSQIYDRSRQCLDSNNNKLI